MHVIFCLNDKETLFKKSERDIPTINKSKRQIKGDKKATGNNTV